MKKMVCCIFGLLVGMVGNVNAKTFPSLKSYVFNGIVIGVGLSEQEIQKRLGKPTQSKKIRNECAETAYIYYYYPSLTLVDRGAGVQLDEIFFSNPKNQLQLSTMVIDANTTLESIKKLGVVYESSEKGVTTYRLEDKNDPSAWLFDFKGKYLFKTRFFSDDC